MHRPHTTHETAYSGDPHIHTSPVDFTYHGATGYTDAEAAERILQSNGLTTRFIQELDGAWTVRFGPLPREHMRAVLDQFAW
jgi:hypothetical protein